MTGVTICGTDFTPRAAEAAEIAGALASRTGSSLVLLHAIEGASIEPAVGALRAEAERLRTRFPGLHIDLRIESGLPDEILAALARRAEPRAELVVVAALGRRAPSRWRLGSVAERVAQTSPVPVLIVRDAGALASWLRDGQSLRVVVGYDFSETSVAAVRWANDLSRVAPCDLVVGHVAPRSDEEARARLERDLDVALRERANTSLPASKIRIETGPGRRASLLAHLAARERADLLVVGTREAHGPARLWQESVSRSALYHAATNVACVPSNSAASERVDAGEQVGLARKLEAHPFLRGVSGRVLERLAAITRERELGRDAVLFREGSQADTLYLIERGLVALELHVPGKGTARLESVHGGDIVGLSWLFPPYRWHLDARAVGPVAALAIDAKLLRSWMDEDPELGRELATRLVRQLYVRLERVRMQRLDLYKAEP